MRCFLRIGTDEYELVSCDSLCETRPMLHLEPPPETVPAAAPPPPPKESRKASVKIVEILGLYDPGRRYKSRSCGYRPGYKSEDGRGRIFLNHGAPSGSEFAWDDLWKKNAQYVDITVRVIPEPREAQLPSDLKVEWAWEDPDDPSDAGMRPDAAREIDPDSRDGEDNRGQCDFPAQAPPTPEDGPPGVPTPARFEGLPGFAIATAGPRFCETAVAEGRSRVRFHGTNVGGDNFRIRVRLKNHPDVEATGSDATGAMTMWKRIDVEYRRMKGAHALPVAELPRAFLPAFVQMDVAAEKGSPRKPFMAETEEDLHTLTREYVRDHFDHAYKPGWFLLVAACDAVKEVSLAPVETVYEGPAEIGEREAADGSTKWETLLIRKAPAALRTAENVSINLYKGEDSVSVYAESVEVDTPGPGDCTLHLHAEVYTPHFVPRDGKVGRYGEVGGVHRHARWVFPTHAFSFPDKSWTPGGLGFAAKLDKIEVFTGKGVVVGTSPDRAHGGSSYFSGRTVVFTSPGIVSKWSDKIRARVLVTMIHELTHAFGLPHLCGQYDTQDPAARTCAMNYRGTWPYAPGTNLLERFSEPDRSRSLCARHLRGIREVHLEDNPALWIW